MVEKSKNGGTFQSKRGRIGEKIISQSYPDDWGLNIWSFTGVTKFFVVKIGGFKLKKSF